MVVELPEQLTGIRYGWHDRYQIPLDHPSALRFYLNNLFVPHSRREMVWALTARRSPLVGQLAAPMLGLGMADLSGRKKGTEAGEAGANASDVRGEDGVERLAGRLEQELKRARVELNPPLSFLSLDDYRHAERQKMVLFIFDRKGERPCAVAKAGSDERHGAVLGREHETMSSLQSRIDEDLRLTMPRPLAAYTERGLTILLESFMPGKSVYFEMRNSWRPRRSAAQHFKLAREWVVRFQKATALRTMRFDEATRDEHVRRPIEEFRRACAPTAEERELLRHVAELSRELKDETWPLVARQGDFWARNLILRGDGVGVVDWEGYREESSPFWDVFLFATSYALSYPWRLGRWAEPTVAFRAAYLEPGWFARLVRSYLLDYCREMEISPKLLELFFPLFLAESALEEKRRFDERGARRQTAANRSGSTQRLPAGEARPGEVGTWRRLFQEYARRTGRACFG